MSVMKGVLDDPVAITLSTVGNSNATGNSVIKLYM